MTCNEDALSCNNHKTIAKHEHRRGFPAIYAPNAAPALVFATIKTPIPAVSGIRFLLAYFPVRAPHCDAGTAQSG